MKQHLAVGMGVLALLASGALGALGIHDGVLGHADGLSRTNAAASPIILRVEPLGEAVTGQQLSEILGAQALQLPRSLADRLSETGLFVPVAIDGGPRSGGWAVFPVDQVLPTGDTIVVFATISVHWVLLDDDQVSPIRLIEVEGARQPFVFD